METRTVLRVVVCSPSDVEPERESLTSVIDDINREIGAHYGLILELVRWETDSHPGFHQQGTNEFVGNHLNIGGSDIFIGILGRRFGAGLEYEFRKAFEAWQDRKRPEIMFYFRREPDIQALTKDKQLKKISAFKRTFPKQGLWWEYNDTSEFPRLVRGHLANYIRNLTDLKRFFEIDSYDVLVQVEPIPDVPIRVPFGLCSANERLITTDNRAHIRKTVTFSSRNCRTERFELSYRTLNSAPGCITIRNKAFLLRHDETAEVDPRRPSAYEANGTDLYFMFTPKPSTYTLDIDVYKGFDQGHRNTRCYLGEQTRCGLFHLTLDLTGYRARGDEVVGPDLVYVEKNQPGFLVGDKPPLRNVIEPSRGSDGIWEWELYNKHGGVVYLEWDFVGAS